MTITFEDLYLENLAILYCALDEVELEFDLHYNITINDWTYKEYQHVLNLKR